MQPTHMLEGEWWDLGGKAKAFHHSTFFFFFCSFFFSPSRYNNTLVLELGEKKKSAVRTWEIKTFKKKNKKGQ